MIEPIFTADRGTTMFALIRSTRATAIADAPEQNAMGFHHARVWTTAVMTAFPALGAAQSSGAARSAAVTVDNDLIALRGKGAPPDYDYTHGASIVVAWAGAPAALARVVGQRRSCRTVESRIAGCVTTAVAVGQRIYTPRRDAPDPVPGERPYGGWLYGGATAHIVAGNRTRSASVEVGYTGPPSLAEPVQNGVHRMFGNESQLGWSRQIPAALGLEVSYAEVLRRQRSVGRSALTAGAVRWGVTAGTLVSALSAGIEGMIGLRGDLPWSPVTPEVEQPTRLYALAGYRQDAILRNVFVDGRGDSGRAERRALVGQLTAGFGYRRRTLAIEYRHVVRGREYAAQPRAHAYGSMTIFLHGFRDPPARTTLDPPAP